MPSSGTLTEIETGFWNASSRANGDFYRSNSTDDALFVFFFGTLGREQCAEIIDGNTTPWADFRFDDIRVIELNRDAALLSYKATAKHEGDDGEMVIFVSSAYVRLDDGWKLALHQQTPAQA